MKFCNFLDSKIAVLTYERQGNPKSLIDVYHEPFGCYVDCVAVPGVERHGGRREDLEVSSGKIEEKGRKGCCCCKGR